MATAVSPDEKGRVFRDLKKRVDAYLAASSMKAVGPREVYVKSAVLAGSWILFYVMFLVFGPNSTCISLLCLVPLMVLTCSLQFCIMHDASHQALSTNRRVNRYAWMSALSVLGGCPIAWHQEHVVRHHGNTNILGSDPDVYASKVLRLHPWDKWYWWQQYQHIYAVPLYGFMWLHWMYNDISNAFLNTYEHSRRKYWVFWCAIVMGWIPHAILGLLLPYLVFQDMWMVGMGYFAFFMGVSFIMTITFVLAHVTDGHSFYPNHDEAQQDWALHQLETSTDFAVDNRVLNFLLGGLNFQVEHHIFPTLCHLHYPAIQKIVKNYCLEHGVVYNEEKTVWKAFLRHLAHLKAMGRKTVLAPAKQVVS